MVRAACLSMALGTLVLLTLDAGVTGCGAAHAPEAQAPATADSATGSPARHTEDAVNAEKDCAPRFMGATKAGVILPPGCERAGPARVGPGDAHVEQATPQPLPQAR